MDETSDVVSQIPDKRIHLIRQENRGQSVAVNNGVAQSRGTFVKLLDADDWINETHLESQLAAIGSRRDVVASCRWGYFVKDFANSAVHRERTNQDYEEPMEWLVDSLTKDRGMMAGWIWLIPRPLWDKTGGYDERLSFCPNNDFQFTINLLLNSAGVRFAGAALYSYRKGAPNSLSARVGQTSMASLFCATDLGTRLMLEAEDSPRIRAICADRFQKWLFRFYPEYPDLVQKTEHRIAELGGSTLELQGGALLKVLKPLIGWKSVRRLQTLAYRFGWGYVLRRKNESRLKAFN